MAELPATNFDGDKESNLKDEHLSEEDTKVKELLQKRKSHKEVLEEIKRKGREELAQKREERKTKREEKVMAENDSPDEEDYYVQTLSAMSISLQKPEKVLGIIIMGQGLVRNATSAITWPFHKLFGNEKCCHRDTAYLPTDVKQFIKIQHEDDVESGRDDFVSTGLVYDELMLKHKNDWDPNFPEKPERISEPFKRCSELHLVERCIRIETQYGTEDMVLLQHTRELLEKVQSTSQMNRQQLQEFSQHYDSVYCNQSSYECALVALGSTIELMEQILKKKITNGLAITRPPGHHSMNDALCGFCIFNNVAIAAKHAVDNLGVKKVLIVDWDVHHGQATQKMFYDDPRVLYFSIHRYEYGNYWPNLRESDYDFIGKDKGQGFNINVPLNQFCPDLILVSAGYDCAIGCPEGEMMVSPACFGHMTHYLMGLADGRVCVCLEGGYCIKSLSESVALTLKALLRDPCPLLPPQNEPSDSVAGTILNVIKVLRPYWSCFHYQDLLEDDTEELCSFEEVNKLPPRSDVKFNKEENESNMFPLTYTYPEEVQEVYLLQKKFDPIIDQLIAETALLRPPYRTCIVYDDDMRAHKADSSCGNVKPNINSFEHVTSYINSWGNAKLNINSCEHVTPYINSCGNAKPNINSFKYVKPNIDSCEYGIPNINSCEYVKLNINSCGNAKPNTNKSEYVKLNINSCEYVKPNINICGNAKPNINSNEYVKPNINSCEYAKPNIDSCEYVKPNINSCEYVIPNTNSCKYVKPNINSCEYVTPNINSCGNAKLNIDSCEYVPNVNSSEYVKPNINSCEYVKPYINSSEYVKPNINSCEYVKHNKNYCEYGKPYISSSEYVKPNIDSSEYAKPNIDRCEYVKPNINCCEYGKPNINSCECIKPNINSCEYVKPNINSCEYAKPNINSCGNAKPNINDCEYVKRNISRSRHATESELQLIHSSKYVEEMKELAEKTVFDLRKLAWNYNSIYLCQVGFKWSGSCKRNNLMILYRDDSEDSEIRIAAYIQMMKCPTDNILSQIKDTLAKEEVNQSGAVEVSSTMSIDAFVTKSGLKMISNFHTSTSVTAKFELDRTRDDHVCLTFPGKVIFRIKQEKRMLATVSVDSKKLYQAEAFVAITESKSATNLEKPKIEIIRPDLDPIDLVEI
ncbi:Polyamine deacetylase HDAC10,Histone deacetylase 6 [Mytilus edulis]|uniref:Polyamine deacetylase HDAC10,Histone deacetylase 6 n=1 Tax=Mytilus edulis TaxID=6550 RepID=A0A8S3U0C4_MYTED|nr:Polyamine deacetylase HDAC10,Histone deacetylase 6 [Mytilus edulis]